MAGQGTAILDFGAFPGSTDASVAVAVPAIGSSNLVEAWIFPAATTDHTTDEHWVDPPDVFAGNVQAGVGFTIYGILRNRLDLAPRAREIDPQRIYGKWNIGWVWN